MKSTIELLNLIKEHLVNVIDLETRGEIESCLSYFADDISLWKMDVETNIANVFDFNLDYIVAHDYYSYSESDNQTVKCRIINSNNFKDINMQLNINDNNNIREVVYKIELNNNIEEILLYSKIFNNNEEDEHNKLCIKTTKQIENGHIVNISRIKELYVDDKIDKRITEELTKIEENKFEKTTLKEKILNRTEKKEKIEDGENISFLQLKNNSTNNE